MPSTRQLLCVVCNRYASESVRDAFDERFPRIMEEMRKVLPGLPAKKESEPTPPPPRTVRLKPPSHDILASLPDV